MLKRKFHVPEDNRTLKALAALDARVYVYCPNRRTKQQFIEDAENEYFCYRDGVSLKEREPEDIMALNRDRTVNFVGYIGCRAADCGRRELRDVFGGFAA